MSPRSEIASRRSAVASARAVAAGMGSVKKIQVWAPRPDCEILSAAGTPTARAAFT